MKKFQQKGQSLMEAIVAIAILLMVIIAILALTISGVTGQKASEQQVIANNLAREGIELVRNLRDSNWVAGVAWDTGLDQPSEGIIDYLSLSIDYSSIDSSLGFNSEDFYSHQPYLQASVYSRVIQIQDICLEENKEYVANLDSFCPAIAQKIGVKVTSIVTWQDEGDFLEVRLEDLLYDWK